MPHLARPPRLAVVIFLCAAHGAAAAAQPARALPKVRVVATGGTIAGAAATARSMPSTVLERVIAVPGGCRWKRTIG